MVILESVGRSPQLKHSIAQWQTLLQDNANSLYHCFKVYIYIYIYSDFHDLSSRIFANWIPVSIVFFHLPVTLLSFPGYVLPHLSLAQSHKPKRLESFLNFALNNYQSPL